MTRPKNPYQLTQQRGKQAFDKVHTLHPDIADAIRGSDLDPHYNDEVILDFLVAVKLAAKKLNDWGLTPMPESWDKEQRVEKCKQAVNEVLYNICMIADYGEV